MSTPSGDFAVTAVICVAEDVKGLETQDSMEAWKTAAMVVMCHGTLSLALWYQRDQLFWYKKG